MVRGMLADLSRQVNAIAAMRLRSPSKSPSRARAGSDSPARAPPSPPLAAVPPEFLPPPSPPLEAAPPPPPATMKLVWHKGADAKNNTIRGTRLVEYMTQYLRGEVQPGNSDLSRVHMAFMCLKQCAQSDEEHGWLRNAKSMADIDLHKALYILHDRLVGRLIACFQLGSAKVPIGLTKWDELMVCLCLFCFRLFSNCLCVFSTAVTCFVPEVNSVCDRLQALDKGDPDKKHTRTFTSVMLTESDIEALPIRPSRHAPKKKMRFS